MTGESQEVMIDPVALRETLGVPLANGPGMTMFSPDGKYGFVCSSFTPELAVVEVQSHRVIKRLAQVSPFCPNIAVSPDNNAVWITLERPHQNRGRTQNQMFSRRSDPSLPDHHVDIPQVDTARVRMAARVGLLASRYKPTYTNV
jgi:DNA-binding beta-propeller fold protein YncE